MQKYIFEISDFKQMESLIKTASSIDSLYQKMYELEIHGKKDTEEYKKLFDYLIIALEVENKIYKDSKLDYKKGFAWFDYLIDNKLPFDYVSDLESIMRQDYNHRIIRRILNSLLYQITLESDVQKALEKDVINAYLVFLQESIDKQNYHNLKKNLIKSKYNTAFIKKEIETEMILSNFTISNTLYISSRFIADLMNMDLEFYNMSKNLYGGKISMFQISELMEMQDESYNDPVKSTTSTLRQCLMRAAFLLMSDEIISEVNDEFHEIIESNEYLCRNPHDKISEQLVINCFKSIKKDQKKPKVLAIEYNAK